METDNVKVCFRVRVKLVRTSEILKLDYVKIVEFQEKPPENDHDFDNTIVYTALLNSDDCETIQFSDSKQVKRVGIQISDLAGKYIKNMTIFIA